MRNYYERRFSRLEIILKLDENARNQFEFKIEPKKRIDSKIHRKIKKPKIAKKKTAETIENQLLSLHFKFNL